jgi:hypothetical protein
MRLLVRGRAAGGLTGGHGNAHRRAGALPDAPARQREDRRQVNGRAQEYAPARGGVAHCACSSGESRRRVDGHGDGGCGSGWGVVETWGDKGGKAVET